MIKPTWREVARQAVDLLRHAIDDTPRAVRLASLLVVMGLIFHYLVVTR